MTPVALLDACVLVPQRLSSLLLTLADEGLYQPRWSEAILDEVERALVGPKIQLKPTLAKRRLDAMRSAFPEAAVVAFEPIVSGLTCHPKDRHVLAAAIAGSCEVLVTHNLRDFPAEACDPYEVEVVDPDLFLLNLMTTDGPACRRALVKEAARFRTPPMNPQELLASLTRVAPTFAHTAHNLWNELVEPASELAAYVVANDDEGPLGEFDRRPDLTNPLHVAFAWSAALTNRDRFRGELEALTWSPRAFGNFEGAASALDRMAFASRVYEAVDDPANAVAFVRLVPEVAQTSLVFEFSHISGRILFMIMKKRIDGTWCVWGLGDRMVPTSSVRDV